MARKVDSREVYQTYLSWPELAEDGLGVRSPLTRGDFKKIYVLGMGGSAAGGDILASWLFATRGIEIEVCKGIVPASEMAGRLVIACSASGNTEETLSMMKTAVARRAALVSMSYNGNLEKESSRAGIPHIQMPKVVAPRYMLPFMVFACVRIVDSALGLDSAEEAKEAVSEMQKLKKVVGLDSPLPLNPSKKTALRLLKKTPVIYGTRTTRGAAIRFKNAVSENSKKHATYNEMPESFHNDVEGWVDPLADFVPIILRDESESEREAHLAEEFVGMLSTMGKEPEQVRGTGGTLLARLMSLVYRLDMASYYMAIGNGRDPFPVPLITRLKEGV